MGKQQTTTYECDWDKCNQIITTDSSPLPRHWIWIESLDGINSSGEKVERGDVYFCCPQHAIEWFDGAVNPPVDK